jgi:hypothetical protein
MIFDTDKQQLFCKKVENHVKRWNCSYLEAILSVGEDMNVEPEVSAKFLTKPIIEKVQEEGRQINLLPKIKNKLPI